MMLFAEWQRLKGAQREGCSPKPCGSGTLQEFLDAGDHVSLYDGRIMMEAKNGDFSEGVFSFARLCPGSVGRKMFHLRFF